MCVSDLKLLIHVSGEQFWLSMKNLLHVFLDKIVELHIVANKQNSDGRNVLLFTLHFRNKVLQGLVFCCDELEGEHICLLIFMLFTCRLVADVDILLKCLLQGFQDLAFENFFHFFMINAINLLEEFLGQLFISVPNVSC